MKGLEHYVGKYLSMLVRSYNPDNYVRLMEEKWRTYVRFVLVTLFISLVLFTCIFVPVAIKWIGGLPAKLEEVQTFSVTTDVSTDHSVVLLDSPRVVLDTTENEHETSYVELTQEGISYPAYVYFGRDFAKWEDIQDLKQPTETRDDLLFWLIVFLLPSILFWVALASVVKLFVVFLFLVMAGYTLPRFFRYRMSFTEAVKTAVLAMPSVMLFGVGLSPLAPGPLWWWGVILTFVYFAIGTFLLSECRRKG